ncbi:SGNH/GDSL hydrolase family protein [Deinococcus hopiensis]|uniref:Phospholipase/lecithinase/hemolysin n=1 Tax=Deinococcus hopiensis KR-140 TaxID=695939 RepID=A0A1W1UHG3_9DEIO|nr:SGNH/GDSL hydrolase family protein [Deinococcus hopiensis]SMB80510.1 Phospholipase/lecithinase/hemolysin [Deinococcus hopiensis KR-140]
MKRFRLLPLAALLVAIVTAGVPAPARPPPTSPAPGAVYVALGDSLTAGFQSGGLGPQAQRDAYPAVIARLAGIPFGLALGQSPGCPPPLGQPLQAGRSCVRAVPGVQNNNLAVPGARVADLLGRTAQNAPDDLTRRMYTLILGPRLTQVAAARKSRPQFVTVWVGANDVQEAVSSGDPARVTPPAQFLSAYRAVLEALRPTGARVVLLTVPDVTAAPLLVAGPLIFRYGYGAPSCRTSANRVDIRLLLTQRSVDCSAPAAVTPAEAGRIRDTLRQYNAGLTRLAAETGALVFDVAGVMASLARPAPDPLRAEQPFGPDFSLDGLHLSSRGQLKLARALLAAGNAQLHFRIPLEGGG